MVIATIDIRQEHASEEIWALQHPAYRAEAALIGVADLPPLQDTVETLRNCGESFLGCRNGEGDLVGAVSYEKEGPNAFAICRLMVHPDSMRQGIASKLMEAMLASEPSTVEWSVTAEIRNYPALRVYERFGFERRGSFKPIPEIEMVKLVREPVAARLQRQDPSPT